MNHTSSAYTSASTDATKLFAIGQVREVRVENGVARNCLGLARTLLSYSNSEFIMHD